MSSIENSLLIRRTTGVFALVLLAFIFLPIFEVQAQVISGDLDCDPLPVEDPALLDQCILLMGTGATGSVANNPVGTGIAGTHGVAAAYNSRDNTILIVGIANVGETTGFGER